MKLQEQGVLREAAGLILLGAVMLPEIIQGTGSTRNEIEDIYPQGSNILISQAINNCTKHNGRVENQARKESLCIINGTKYHLGLLLDKNFKTSQQSINHYPDNSILVGRSVFNAETYEAQGEKFTLTPPPNYGKIQETASYCNGTMVIGKNHCNTTTQVAFNKY